MSKGKLSFDPKLGKFSLEDFKVYAKKHHDVSATDAEKIHKGLVQELAAKEKAKEKALSK